MTLTCEFLVWHPFPTLALGTTEFSLSFFSTCFSTVSPPPFVRPFPVSPRRFLPAMAVFVAKPTLAKPTLANVGIVYCTCGHFLRDDTTENKKYIKSVLDLFSIPNFYIRKGRPHGHKYGKRGGCKEFHTAKQLQKRCQKKQYENIHDRVGSL